MERQILKGLTRVAFLQTFMSPHDCPTFLQWKTPNDWIRTSLYLELAWKTPYLCNRAYTLLPNTCTIVLIACRCVDTHSGLHEDMCRDISANFHGLGEMTKFTLRRTSYIHSRRRHSTSQRRSTSNKCCKYLTCQKCLMLQAPPHKVLEVLESTTPQGVTSFLSNFI